MAAIAQRNVQAMKGLATPTGINSANVIERLAIARSMASPGSPEQAAAVCAIEELGVEVSPEFVELGVDTLLLTHVLNTLHAGEPIGEVHKLVAARTIGRLWQAAFSAPAGFDQYISHSLLGHIPAYLSFFLAPHPPEIECATATYLSFIQAIDLLQTAVCMTGLPSHHVGQFEQLPQWRNRCGTMSARFGGYDRLTLHKRVEPVGPDCVRMSLLLVEDATDDTVGVISCVIVRTAHGTLDDILDLAPRINSVLAQEIIRSAFTPIGAPLLLHPRIRRLLTNIEGRVFTMAIWDGAYIKRSWRGHGLGGRLLRRFLVEADSVEILLGSPGAALLSRSRPALPFGARAALIGSRLRQAKHWAWLGAEYLVNGVMGMSQFAIEDARKLAASD